MITAVQTPEGHYIVTMDKADRRAIHKLADAYSISFVAMLVGCINKGIDVIGSHVNTGEEQDRKPDGSG